jgi:transposase InsO family protein
MDLEDARATVRYLIRDRDSKFPALFDQILAEAGIQVVLTGVRMPRMNAVMERWVQTCCHELLDRTLIWNESHLRRALREFEQHHNAHRPHPRVRRNSRVLEVPRD